MTVVITSSLPSFYHLTHIFILKLRWGKLLEFSQLIIEKLRNEMGFSVLEILDKIYKCNCHQISRSDSSLDREFPWDHLFFSPSSYREIEFYYICRIVPHFDFSYQNKEPWLIIGNKDYLVASWAIINPICNFRFVIVRLTRVLRWSMSNHEKL